MTNHLTWIVIRGNRRGFDAKSEIIRWGWTHLSSFLHPSSSFSPSLSLLSFSSVPLGFHQGVCDLEKWQVLVKRDSIFTILFFIAFLTFLEFKLENISRFPSKKLQVSVELNLALPWFHYWVVAQRIHKNSVLWIDFGF